jgi:FkbM family methyltransferase
MIQTLRYIWNHPLARQSRLEAISKYVRWQLGTSVLGWPVVVPFVGNSKLVVARGMHGATGNVYCGLHEFADMAFLLHFLRPADRFVDIGANVGSYTILAAAVVGATAVSIEPVPETFALLQCNLRINNVEHLVTAKNLALGERAEELRISLDRGTQNSIVGADYSGRVVQVSVEPLDSLLNGQATALWKVDVEGYELHVLDGAQQSITNESLQAVILESDSEAIHHIMKSHGFQLAAYDPWKRELTIAHSREHVTENHLWVRNLEKVAARCQEGPTYSILSISV